MNDLLKTSQDISTHHISRKKLSEIRARQKRERKAKEYLGEVPAKLRIFYNK